MGGIARAFTTRKVKMSLEIAQEAREKAAAKEKALAAAQRINTKPPNTLTKPANLTKQPPARTKSTANNNDRSKISGPIELIHTTNMLSYNAPDLPRPSSPSRRSTKSSVQTDDDSEGAPSTAASSPPTSPDVASSELKRSASQEQNHLSSYFIPEQTAQSPPATTAAPAIPQRAPTHTKKASIDAATRHRSNSTRGLRESPASNPRLNAAFTRSPSTATARSVRSQESDKSHISTPSTASIATTAPSLSNAKSQPAAAQHPFGSELAQVTEIAEEFGVRQNIAIVDEEERELISRGLCKFSADVYLKDVEDLWSFFFTDHKMVPVISAPPTWI